MKKFTFWLFVNILFSQVAFSQNQTLIDSLKVALIPATDGERFDLLNALAWEYRFASPDSMILLSQEALELGQQLKLSKNLARPFNFKGIAFNYKGERLKAYEYYTRALNISVAQADSFQIAHANNNIGRLFYDQGMLSRAYPYFENARRIFRTINNSSGLAYTHQSLGNIYKSQRDYTKAEDNFLRALQIRLKLGNVRDIMSAMMYLGRHYLEANEVGKALHFFLQADSTGQVIGDQINRAETKTYLAETYLALGMTDEAEAMCLNGLDVILRVNNVRMMPQAYQTMGQVYYHKHDFAKARDYFQQSLHVANQINDLNGKMDASYYLWKVSERLNQPMESLRHHNEYLVLRDSVKDLDLARQVERKQFEMEIQRRDQENELLKETEAKNEAIIQRQRLQNIFLIVSTLLVSVLGLMQWRHAKKRRFVNEQLIRQNREIENQRQEIVRQNEKLSKRNQELSDLNHEKDTLMGIVAHDLKSPLNQIQGLVNLMAMNANETSDDRLTFVARLKEATTSGLDLITDLLDVHMLEENVQPHLTTFDISEFLAKKMELFHLIADAKDIRLNMARGESKWVISDRDYLDRIVDNLLSNAIKFSPPHTVVEVSAGGDRDEFWISVRDNGPGFSPSDKLRLYQKFRKLSARPTGGESSNGLGLAIVKTLVDRLNGAIELSSEEGKGSHFVVRFPQLEGVEQ